MEKSTVATSGTRGAGPDSRGLKLGGPMAMTEAGCRTTPELKRNASGSVPTWRYRADLGVVSADPSRSAPNDGLD